MNYRVSWKRVARDQLADLWVAATDRNAVTRAANTLDSMLARDPLNYGESRSGSRRIVVEPPVVAVFKIDPALRKVTVLSVRCLPAHG
jgi:hypothetical protein